MEIGDEIEVKTFFFFFLENICILGEKTKTYLPQVIFTTAHTAFHSAHTKQALRGNVGHGSANAFYYDAYFFTSKATRHWFTRIDYLLLAGVAKIIVQRAVMAFDYVIIRQSVGKQRKGIQKNILRNKNCDMTVAMGADKRCAASG